MIIQYTISVYDSVSVSSIVFCIEGNKTKRKMMILLYLTVYCYTQIRLVCIGIGLTITQVKYIDNSRNKFYYVYFQNIFSGPPRFTRSIFNTSYT